MSQVPVLNKPLSQSCTLLVADDDSAMRSLLVDELSDNGCQVIESVDGHDVFSKLKIYAPNLVITDLKMPGGGFEYLQKLKEVLHNCPIILITAFGNSQTKKKALAYGMAAYFDKPVRVTDLKGALREFCPLCQGDTCQIFPL